MTTADYQKSPLFLLNEVLGKWNGYFFCPASFIEDEVDLTFFEQAILTMNLSERQIIVLRERFFQNKTYAQIADAHNISRVHARNICGRAIRLMRQPNNMRTLRRAVVGISNMHRVMHDSSQKPT